MYCFVSCSCLFVFSAISQLSAVTCQLSGCQVEVSQISLLLRSLRHRNNIISQDVVERWVLLYIYPQSTYWVSHYCNPPPPLSTTAPNKPQTKFLNELSNAFWLNTLLGQSKVLLDINKGFGGTLSTVL